MIRSFLSRHAGLLLLVVGVIAYITISGMLGACPACRAVTNSAGLPQLGK